MEGSIEELARYRYEVSSEALKDAEILFENGRYKNALNRAYYAIFHAVVMKGKILHAKGRLDEALALYKRELPDWYQTAGQKSEQLFAKNTSEFAAFLDENIMELSRFLLNKVSKKIWFCEAGTITEKEERVAKICKVLKKLEEYEDGENIEALIEYFERDFSGKVQCFGE